MNCLADTNGWLPRGARFSAPCLTRVIQLYSYGYNLESITEILKREFQDIEAYPIQMDLIETMISKNREMLEEYKQELIAELQKETEEYAKVLVRKGLQNDNKIVDRLISKEEELMDLMSALNLTDLDDKGRPKDLMVFLATIDALEKTNKLKAKLAGLDVMREVEAFKMKEEVKRIYSNPDLIPPANGREVTHNGRPAILG